MTNIGRNSGSGLSKGLLEFWQHANRIFKLLSRAWCCSCQFSHGANLALTHRRSPEVDLKVLFWFSEPGHASGPWAWQETRIRKLESTTAVVTAVPKTSLIMNQQKSALKQPLVPKDDTFCIPTAETANPKAIK